MLKMKVSIEHFCMSTGLSKEIVKEMVISGDIKPTLGDDGSVYFKTKDFTVPLVAAYMSNVQITPAMARVNYEAIRNGEVTPMKKPKPDLKLVSGDSEGANSKNANKVTTYEALSNMKEGLLLHTIPPIEGLNAIGRSIWKVSMRTLVQQSVFKTSDMPTLINYCQAADTLAEIRNATKTYMIGTRVNPLVNAAEKARSTMRVLAAELQLTPNSRSRARTINTSSVPVNSDNEKGWEEALK